MKAAKNVQRANAALIKLFKSIQVCLITCHRQKLPLKKMVINASRRDPTRYRLRIQYHKPPK